MVNAGYTARSSEIANWVRNNNNNNNKNINNDDAQNNTIQLWSQKKLSKLKRKRRSRGRGRELLITIKDMSSARFFWCWCCCRRKYTNNSDCFLVWSGGNKQQVTSNFALQLRAGCRVVLCRMCRANEHGAMQHNVHWPASCQVVSTNLGPHPSPTLLSKPLHSLILKNETELFWKKNRLEFWITIKNVSSFWLSSIFKMRTINTPHLNMQTITIKKNANTTLQ